MNYTENPFFGNKLFTTWELKQQILEEWIILVHLSKLKKYPKALSSDASRYHITNKLY